MQPESVTAERLRHALAEAQSMFPATDEAENNSSADEEVSFNFEGLLKKKDEECEQLVSELASANKDISDLKGEIEELERRLDSKSEETERIRLDLHETRLRLAENPDTLELEKTKVERYVLEVRLAEEVSSRERFELEAATLRRELEAKTAEADAAHNSTAVAIAEVAQMRIDVSRKEDEVMESLVEVANVTEAMNRAVQEASSASENAEALKKEVEDLRGQLRDALDRLEAGPSSFVASVPSEAVSVQPDLFGNTAQEASVEVKGNLYSPDLCASLIENVASMTVEEKDNMIAELSAYFNFTEQPCNEIQFSKY